MSETLRRPSTDIFTTPWWRTATSPRVAIITSPWPTASRTISCHDGFAPSNTITRKTRRYPKYSFSLVRSLSLSLSRIIAFSYRYNSGEFVSCCSNCTISLFIYYLCCFYILITIRWLRFFCLYIFVYIVEN